MASNEHLPIGAATFLSLQFTTRGDRNVAPPKRATAMKLWTLCVLLLGFLVRVAGAAGTEVAFDAANKLYEESKFTEAAAGYEKLLAESNRSASIYYNLGTAYYKAGQMGRAIAAYRQAERLTPRDPNLRANLQFVRKRVNGEDKSPLPLWKSWTTLLTLNEGALLAAAALWIWFLLLAAREFRPAWKMPLSRSTLMAGLLTFLLWACLGVAAYVRFGEIPAIVIMKEAVVRYGPIDESQTAFTLPDGAEVTVLDTKGDWLQVREGAKRTGWLKRNQVTVMSETSPAPPKK